MTQKERERWAKLFWTWGKKKSHFFKVKIYDFFFARDKFS